MFAHYNLLPSVRPALPIFCIWTMFLNYNQRFHHRRLAKDTAIQIVGQSFHAWLSVQIGTQESDAIASIAGMPVEGTLAFGAGSKTQKRAEKSVARPTMTVFGLQSSRMIKAMWDAKGVAFFSYERICHWKKSIQIEKVSRSEQLLQKCLHFGVDRLLDGHSIFFHAWFWK